MIDLALLRDDFEKFKKNVLRKSPDFDVVKLVELDKKLRELRQKTEDLRNERNSLSAMASKSLTEEIRNKSIAINKELKIKEEELRSAEENFKSFALSCPNLLSDEVQDGNKESNKVVKTFGKKPEFDFKPKNHLELNEKYKWFDFEAGAQMSGAQFVVYKGLAVKMMYALTQMMLKNNVKHGFEPTIVPYLLNQQSLINSGNLPKFSEELYKVTEDNLYVLPTSEVPLTNIYAGKILSADQLPIRQTSWTSCFRREAGGYGSLERGLIRIHQFEKVEIYSICLPEDSEKEQQKMLACAEDLLNQLELHYQISLLAAQDCSFQSAKTYDIELWLPGQNRYYEVSSASNCTDFQSRRAMIRYKEKVDSKPKLVHTLNASSLALPRLMVALMENNQQEDGTIKLPKALVEAMNNLW